MDYLIRMVEDHCENIPLVEEVRCLKEVLLKGKMLSGGLREMTLNFYPEHLDQIVEAVQQAKRGKIKTIEDFKNEDGTLF